MQTKTRAKRHGVVQHHANKRGTQKKQHILIGRGDLCCALALFPRPVEMSVSVLHQGKWVATLPEHVRSSSRAAADPVVVKLGDGFGVDAIHDVCETLLESGSASAAAKSVTFVKYWDMVLMRSVCAALGVDFDRWIRPSFATLGALELCVFQAASFDTTGLVRFEYGRVRVQYRSSRIVLNGTYDYAVRADGFQLRTRARLCLAADGDNLVMHYHDDHTKVAVVFHNKTPWRLAIAVPPAVPQYNSDELKAE